MYMFIGWDLESLGGLKLPGALLYVTRNYVQNNKYQSFEEFLMSSKYLSLGANRVLSPLFNASNYYVLNICA